MDEKQLREYIIRPGLTSCGIYSESAEELLILTCAQESRLGHYIKQIKGPAMGIFQMEPFTYNAILDYLKLRQSDLLKKILQICYYSAPPPPTSLIHNLKYAAIMCRVHYMRFSEPLPEPENILGLAQYWKKYYNSEHGKGTVEEAVLNYRNLVDPEDIKF